MLSLVTYVHMEKYVPTYAVLLKFYPIYIHHIIVAIISILYFTFTEPSKPHTMKF